MGVLIVLGMTLKANPAIQIPAQVLSHVILANLLIYKKIYHPSKLYLEYMERMGNLLCKLW